MPRSWSQGTAGSAVLEPPRRAVALRPGGGEEVEERDGVERLGPEDTGPRPDAGGQQLESDDRVDSGLPDDALGSVVAHRVRVVGHVVEVRAARLPVLAGARDPDAGAGLALHPRSDGGWVGEHRGHHITWADLHPLDRDGVR